jgi:hypothetical protein
MAYIGNTLRTAQPNYQIIDDISASFNGSTTSFALQVGGVTPAPFPVSAQHCLISVGGVIQQPDPTGADGFLLSGSNIVFSAAPSFGEDFFGVVLAGADYINVGAEFPDGSVANPSITFDSDRDTGLYRKGANNIAITTNGTERVSVGTSEVVFNDGGNDIDFRIEGDTDSNLFFVDAGNERVGIGTTTINSLFEVRGTSDGQNILHLSNSAGTSDGSAENQIRVTCNGNIAWGNLDIQAYQTIFTQNGGEKARIDPSGRLLVGTTSATSSALFQLQGRVGAANDYANMSLRRGSIPTSGSQPLGVVNFTDDSHNVGAQFFAESDGGSWTSGSDHRTRLVFATTTAASASPTAKFTIYNYGLSSHESTSHVNQTVTSVGAGTSVFLYRGHHSSGSTSFNVWSNGNVQNTNNSYSSLSDIRLKENIVDASSQWDDLKAIQIRKYNFKEETGHETHTQLGVIAQEIELISPGLVTESPDFDKEGNDIGTTTKSVNYSVLSMKAVKALQEAMERIETLEAEKTAQQTQLDDLIARVTALETN